MTIPEKAVEWALSVANDEAHGYDQGNRWGPDYDCSSFVISAYKHAGLDLQSTYTGNMKADFMRHGFRDVTADVNLATGAWMEPGDVLLNETHHTAMVVGYLRIVEATGNENGGVTGGKTGDQTGREITINPYRNYGAGGWDCVLRYEGPELGEEEPDDDGPDTYVVKQGDSLWKIAWDHGMTYLELARINNLDPNKFIYPGQVLKLKPDADPPEEPPEAPDEPDDIYIVKPGDSLWQIAQDKLGKGWKWWRIAEANDLKDPYIIYPGQKLKMPKGED